MVTTLRGSRVRHRIAELGWTIEMAGERSGIPHGTLKNNTREPNPQPISLLRAYDLLRALNQPGYRQLTIEDILSSGGDGVPDEPPSKEQEQETNTGPGRDGGSGTGPGKGRKTAPKRFDGAAA
jgi:hypothetical protein